MKIKIFIITLLICIFNMHAFAATESDNLDKLINDLESKFGINIIVQNENNETDYNSLLILNKGLNMFPKGFIKEAADYYLNKGISTNLIVNNTEKISDLFSEYVMNEKSANISVNILQNNTYKNLCAASEEVFVHEMSHFVGGYLYEVYGYEKLKTEFENLNSKYDYGSWKDGCENIFLNRHSSLSFEEDVANLIWTAVVHPDRLRNINDDQHTVIHQKIELLINAAEQSFSSIGSVRLWKLAIPQKPVEWAKESIAQMKALSLIPEEYDGLYSSDITKEAFYDLTFKALEKKIGSENFSNIFGMIEKEQYMSIDPLKGEVLFDKNENIEKIENNENSENEYITRLEIAKFLGYVSSNLGMNISDYASEVKYSDISDVSEKEKLFIFFVSNKGFLKGSDELFKPFENCTYQEAYIILMRFYNSL